ncbi:hypothetical protein ACI48J_13465 [Paenibacillus chitinolyticus]
MIFLQIMASEKDNGNENNKATVDYVVKLSELLRKTGGSST